MQPNRGEGGRATRGGVDHVRCWGCPGLSIKGLIQGTGLGRSGPETVRPNRGENSAPGLAGRRIGSQSSGAPHRHCVASNHWCFDGSVSWGGGVAASG
jgi:hypothetical protein